MRTDLVANEVAKANMKPGSQLADKSVTNIFEDLCRRYNHILDIIY